MRTLVLALLALQGCSSAAAQSSSSGPPTAAASRVGSADEARIVLEAPP